MLAVSAAGRGGAVADRVVSRVIPTLDIPTLMDLISIVRAFAAEDAVYNMDDYYGYGECAYCEVPYDSCATPPAQHLETCPYARARKYLV